MTPLPLHGQVRPIKVEQGGEGGWSSSSLDTSHEAILSSTTPPILRRRPRKREADDNEVSTSNAFCQIFRGVHRFFLFTYHWSIDM